MKKILIYLSLLLSLVFLTSCAKYTYKIDQEKIYIRDGMTLDISNDKNISYKVLSKIDGVSINGSTITISDSVKNGTQILIGLFNKDTFIATMIGEVKKDIANPVISFTNLSNNVKDGDDIKASSSPVMSITYSLKNNPVGILINSSSGTLHFLDSVIEGTKFTVIASAGGATIEKEFIYAKENLVTIKEGKEKLIVSSDDPFELEVSLDFKGNTEAINEGILAVELNGKKLNQSEYSFISDDQTLVISGNSFKNLPLGFNKLNIVTLRNSIEGEVLVAHFISTPEDLANINNTIESLNSYYVLSADIDLKDYLSKGSKGYNAGKGWNPIGLYKDTTDSSATEYAFGGYFDGNGHTISNLYINRNDERGFNSGLFGYTTVNSVIMNLNVSSDKDQTYKVCSYSGGLVGANNGTILNCSADVDITADDAHKVLGGFVGRNEGTIRNSYSIGAVYSSNQAGGFAGLDMGLIENSYSIHSDLLFDSTGVSDKNYVFESKELLLASGFTTLNYPWILRINDYPYIESVIVNNSIKDIKVLNQELYVTKGDTFKVEIEAIPKIVDTIYTKEFEIIEGNGVTINDQGIVSTTQAQDDYFKVKVKMGNIEKIIKVNVYQKPKSINFRDTQEYTVSAGDYIKLDGYVLPEKALQDIRYQITSPLPGVRMYSDDVIEIKRDASSGTFEVTAYARDITKTITINVIGFETFIDSTKYLLSDREENVVFTLPSGATSELVTVKAYSKVVEYTVDGDNVTITSTWLKELYGERIPIDFVTKTKTYTGEVRVLKNQYESFYTVYPRNTFKTFPNNTYSIGSDFSEDIKFTLPDTFDTSKIKSIKRYYDEIESSIEGFNLTLRYNDFKDFTNSAVPVVITLDDDTKYLLEVNVYSDSISSFYYLSRNKDIIFSGQSLVKETDELNNIELVVGGDIKDIKLYYESINYSKTSNKIIIDLSNKNLDKFKKIPLVITASDNSRVGYSLIIVDDKEEDIIISSKEEFIEFKNDHSNYSKNIVLINDIDFEGMSLSSIGSNKDGGEFTGKFFGNGYALKNLNITRNDFSGEYMSEGELKGDETVNKYHSSYYVVGLFSVLKGELYDLTLENVNVCPTFNSTKTGNYVGIISGKLEGKAININLINCNSDAAADGSQRVVGIIYATSSADAVYEVIYNGQLIQGGK